MKECEWKDEYKVIEIMYIIHFKISLSRAKMQIVDLTAIHLEKDLRSFTS